MQSLYLCYFGLREPLVQTQVLPYLRQLAASGFRMGLLTFEAVSPTQWDGEAADVWQQRLADDGITWVWRRYHKRPQVASTLFDIAVGGAAVRSYLQQHGPTLLHARGHWAGVMAASVARSFQVPFLFDIRGFAPEEYVDAGLWQEQSLRYRVSKWIERSLLNEASGFVVLTERARSILFPNCGTEDQQGRPVSVIPCCVDVERFAPAWREDRDALRRELGFEGCRVYVYLGALGGWYLTDAMADFFQVAIEGDEEAQVLIITQSDPNLLTRPLEKAGVPLDRVRTLRLSPSEVPRYLRAADVGLSFIKPSYSKQASSPTKLAEYLAAGLPVIANAGVGDVDTLLLEERVGILVRELTTRCYRDALRQVPSLGTAEAVSARCRRLAAERFDLVQVGAARYIDLYRRLAALSIPRK